MIFGKEFFFGGRGGENSVILNSLLHIYTAIIIDFGLFEMVFTKTHFKLLFVNF